MSQIVTMPQLGETVTEGTILRWLVQVGDGVKEDLQITFSLLNGMYWLFDRL